ncbi:hypothetical protein Ahy_B03g061904 isoform A [Arachis hypogaea]|uniref:Cullin N-terminal domain-containing protein n=1 Tax=Arachis hypogaea TaxID=3818 RepID=A0A444ZSP4_ARAHY|nr:hypothetical protein Ahy_B03g061904 isoform A [Arachis hypogaea]
MSHPTKRSATASTDASSSSAAAAATMKKAKSQAVACSLDSKNSLSHHHHHHHRQHPDDALFDPAASPMALDDDLKSDDQNARGAVAANLSRKKATPPQPAKKLLIKLRKGKPTMPPNFEEDTWETVRSAISAIFLKQHLSCDLEKLYQAVSDMCLHKMGANLYQRIERECETHISAALQSLVGQSPDLVVFLSLVERCWQDLSDQMLMIRGIALYLDRTYVKQTTNVRSLWDMGLQLFRKHLSLCQEVEHKTVTGLLRMIESERLGEAVDRTLLNHLLKMFTALGIYAESFEKPFLECTSEFYAAEAGKKRGGGGLFGGLQLIQR